jgi:metal-sulfur cluster biosynthetic enzyme
MTTVEQVWAALGTVRDPELDESITELRFVTEVVEHDGDVLVRLRLPTYFCAPNFAYLMVADARDAVTRVTDVRNVEVRLEDHFASDEINAGVAAQSGFAGSFPGEADDELAELRLVFQRKAYLASLERLCRRLIQEGREVTGLRIGEVPQYPELIGFLRRRNDIGLPSGPHDVVLLDDKGDLIPAEQTAARLRFAKAVRVSIDGNAIFCRGLLRTRYGPEIEKEGA